MCIWHKILALGEIWIVAIAFVQAWLHVVTFATLQTLLLKLIWHQMIQAKVFMKIYLKAYNWLATPHFSLIWFRFIQHIHERYEGCKISLPRKVRREIYLRKNEQFNDARAFNLAWCDVWWLKILYLSISTDG